MRLAGIAAVRRGSRSEGIGDDAKRRRANRASRRGRLWTVKWSEGTFGDSSSQASGVERTFTFEILGFGGTLATLSRFLDRQSLNPGLLSKKYEPAEKSSYIPG